MNHTDGRSLDAGDVARYLEGNPQFFDQYASLLAQLYIPHPHGGRAISITERQILSLREKSKQLESKLAELIHCGRENDALSTKVHRLAVALLRTTDVSHALHALYFHLSEDFSVPNYATRLWDVHRVSDAPEFGEVSDALRIFSAGLAEAVCVGSAGSEEIIRWFGERGSHVRSLALIPLRRDAQTHGLLALGSEDPERFYAEMDVMYLRRIGEMVSAALLRKE